MFHPKLNELLLGAVVAVGTVVFMTIFDRLTKRAQDKYFERLMKKEEIPS